MTRLEKWPMSVPAALIASYAAASGARFCFVVRFVIARFLVEDFPRAFRFAEIAFPFARAVLCVAAFFLDAVVFGLGLAWPCVLDGFFLDGDAA